MPVALVNGGKGGDDSESEEDEDEPTGQLSNNSTPKKPINGVEAAANKTPTSSSIAQTELKDDDEVSSFEDEEDESDEFVDAVDAGGALSGSEGKEERKKSSSKAAKMVRDSMETKSEMGERLGKPLSSLTYEDVKLSEEDVKKVTLEAFGSESIPS